MSARKRRVEQPAPRSTASRPAPALRPGIAAGPRTWRVALLLFVLLWPIYVVNFRLLGAGDSIPTRLLPFSVLREGNLNLDEFSWERRSDGRLPYYVLQLGDHIYSVSTIATALVVTPLYVLPAWWLAAHGIGYDDVRARVVIVAMERIAAATLTALSASLLFVVLRRLTTWRWALALALVYALGTSTWSISSQALWAHGLSEVCLVILCALLLAPAPSRAAVAAAGLTAAVMVANRPQMAVFALLALLFVWVRHRRHVLAFAAVPALVGVLLLAYNRAVFGGLTGGYGGFGHFDAPLLEGVAGLVVSPNRGLLVYTPIMLFAFWGAVRVWRVEAPAWLRWLSAGVLLHVLVYAKFREWWGGYTYGPRYFTDVLPALIIFLVYGLVPLCRARAVPVLAAALALYGVGVQAIGVYAADDRWNREPAPLEVHPDRVWDWSDLQIVRALHNGWRAGELAPAMASAFRAPVPAKVAPLSAADLASAIAARGLPAAVHRGTTATATVAITNRGRATWPAFSGEGVISARYLTFLLARWLAHGRPLDGAGDVVALPRNVSPGETVEVPLSLPAPPVAGDFELELRVTQAVDGRRGVVGDDALRVPVRVE
jgi:hypothetical protein